MRDFVIAAGEVERAALEQTAKEIRSGNVRDIGATLRNVTVSKAVNTDKLLILTGRPSEIRQQESFSDVLNRLMQKHPGLFVEGSAEELAPAGERVTQEIEQIERRREAA